ncbi:MAG: hypothetical protein AAGM22_04745 [Acidobacteriota bacterium]
MTTDPLHEEARRYAALLMQKARELGVEATDWGDAVSFEFTDGCDALHWEFRRAVPSGTLKPAAQKFFQRYRRLDRARSQALRALLWLAHGRGQSVDRSRSGFWSFDTKGQTLQTAVNWTLTREVEDPSAILDAVARRAFFPWRSADRDHLRSLLAQTADPPVDESTLRQHSAAEVLRRERELQDQLFPDIGDPFGPRQPVSKSVLADAGARAAACLRRFQRAAEKDFQLVFRSAAPPRRRRQSSALAEWNLGQARETLRRLGDGPEDSGGQAWLLRLLASQRLVEAGDEDRRPELAATVERWWENGGHDIQDHLDLLGLLPELEELVEDVLTHEETPVPEAHLLDWHLPTRRNLHRRLAEVGETMQSAGDGPSREELFGTFCEIAFKVGPQWTRQLTGERHLTWIHGWVRRRADEATSFQLWLELDDIAQLAGLLTWRDVADALLRRPDLRAVLFAPLWRHLEAAGDGTPSFTTLPGDALSGLVGATPGDPRLTPLLAEALDLRERVGASPLEDLDLSEAWNAHADPIDSVQS